MLSTITNTNIDVVKVAVDTFIGVGLMERLDDGALFINEVNKMLGCETEHAERKREYRREKALLRQIKDNVSPKKDNVPDFVSQEIDIEKEIEKDTTYYPPQSQIRQLGGDGGGFLNDWLNCMKQHNYQFLENEIIVIKEWAKYKVDRNEVVSLQQIEFTLKQLNQHKLANQNIVYLIETSISRGYKGIMEPTKGSLSHSTAMSTPSKRYLSEDYITPETPSQKIELRNYLERCYMRDRIDPRTKEPLSKDQIIIFIKHLKQMEKQHVSITDYIYQNEVMTGVCLLEQLLLTAA